MRPKYNVKACQAMTICTCRMRLVAWRRCRAPVRHLAAGLTPKTLYHLGLVIWVVGKYVAGLFERRASSQLLTGNNSFQQSRLVIACGEQIALAIDDFGKGGKIVIAAEDIDERLCLDLLGIHRRGAEIAQEGVVHPIVLAAF